MEVKIGLFIANKMTIVVQEYFQEWVWNWLQIVGKNI